MKTWQKKLIHIVQPFFKKIESVHGIDHAEKVFKNAQIIAKDFPNADIDVLFAASYLHDVGYVNLKNGTGYHGHHSVDWIEKLSKEQSFPKEKVSLIKQIVRLHDKQKLNGKLPSEVLIFHDADKLEAIGAIGLARNFAFSGSIGRRIWEPKIKRKPYLPYGGNISAMHTILDWEMKKKFYTKKGKKIAKGRRDFMRAFVKRFFEEWNFKK